MELLKFTKRYLSLNVAVMLIFSVAARSQSVPTGQIRGVIIDKASKQPLAGASLAIKESPLSVTSDSSGKFAISGLKQGYYSMVVSSVGYQEKVLNDIRVYANKANYIEIELTAAVANLDSVTIKAYKYENSPLTPVSTYGFSREEISRNPGAQGDIFRAIGMLPGVSSSGGEYSAIAVRGQGTRDNIYMVDDIPLTEVGHLEGGPGGFNDPNGGRFSIFAPRVIDNAEFQGGGFAAQYGRRSASFLGLGIKEGNKIDPIIDGQLDLLGFTLNYDGPSYFDKKTSLFVSARYQDFTALVNVINKKDIGIPRYGDLVIKSVTQIDRRNKLSFISILSPEQYTRGVNNVVQDKDLNDLGVVDSKKNKWVLGINLRTLTGKTSYLKNILFFTRSTIDNASGMAYPQTDSAGHLIDAGQIFHNDTIMKINYAETKVGYRSIYSVNFAGRSKLVTGVDVDRVTLSNYRHLSQPDTSYMYNSSDISNNPLQYYYVSDTAHFNARFNGSAFDVSAYAEYSFLLWRHLTINTGLRWDYTGFCQQHLFSPRFSASYQLNAASSLNASAGIYYQDPVYSEIADQPVDKKLREEKVIQYIVGYKNYFTPDLKLTVEGWYKDLSSLVVRPLSESSEQNNLGTGWAAGVDVSLTKRLAKNLHGQISYSYMQSRRDDHDGRGEYNFEFNQPNQVNVLVSYQKGKHWILSSKFRYATGKPTGSYIVHANVFDSGTFKRYSEEVSGKNDLRLSDFISLDVRADYSMQIRKFGLTVFMDIVNILNRANENAQEFNPITGRVYYDGLGIFPTFGIKAAF